METNLKPGKLVVLPGKTEWQC